MKEMLKDATPTIAKQLGLNLYFSFAVLSVFTFVQSRQLYYACSIVIGFLVISAFFLPRYRFCVQRDISNIDLIKIGTVCIVFFVSTAALFYVNISKVFKISNLLVVLETFICIITSPSLNVFVAVILFRNKVDRD